MLEVAYSPPAFQNLSFRHTNSSLQRRCSVRLRYEMTHERYNRQRAEAGLEMQMNLLNDILTANLDRGWERVNDFGRRFWEAI